MIQAIIAVYAMCAVAAFLVGLYFLVFFHVQMRPIRKKAYGEKSWLDRQADFSLHPIATFEMEMNLLKDSKEDEDGFNANRRKARRALILGWTIPLLSLAVGLLLVLAYGIFGVSHG